MDRMTQDLNFYRPFINQRYPIAVFYFHLLNFKAVRYTHVDNGRVIILTNHVATNLYQ